MMEDINKTGPVTTENTDKAENQTQPSPEKTEAENKVAEIKTEAEAEIKKAESEVREKVKEAAPSETAEKPASAAKPAAGTKTAVGTRPAGTKPAAAGTRPAGTKPAAAGTRPAGTKTAAAGTRPAGAKPAAGTRPAGTKPATGTKTAATGTRPAGTKTAAGTRPAGAKPATGTKPAAAGTKSVAGATKPITVGVKAAAKTSPSSAAPEVKPEGTAPIKAEQAAEGTPELKADIRVDDLENKITASTEVTAAAKLKAEQENDRYAYFSEDYDEEDDGRGGRSTGRIILTLILILAGIVAAAYVFCGIYFKNHFYPGTVINGHEVSGMTVEDVKSTLQSSIDTYTLTIAERDKKTETLTAADVGMTYQDDKKIDSLMEEQDSWKFFLHIFGDKTYTFTAATSYDKEKTDSAISKLDCLNKDVISPKDAVLVENEDGAYIEREEDGNEVNRELLAEAVYAALDEASEKVDITSPDCYNYPSVKSDDENLVSRMNEWNALLELNITYAFGNNVETINKDVLLPHMVDDGSTVTVDPDWITQLVAAWGEKYNTFGRERQFKTHSGKVVTLPAATLHTGEVDASGNEYEHTSDYGYLLDNDATAADLTSAIQDKTSGERQPIFRYSGMGWDNDGLTGTYCEISLADQHLWLYKDGQQIMDCSIVSGKSGADTQTYTGCFAVDAKKSPAEITDPAAKDKTTEVGYWIPCDGRRGLCDTGTRTTFGGTEVETNGTSGYIDIPSSAMETIYNTLEIGNAICIY